MRALIYLCVSVLRLHVHMAGGGGGGLVLVPGGGLHLPLRPRQTSKEKENGLLPGSAEQHLLTLSLHRQRRPLMCLLLHQMSRE